MLDSLSNYILEHSSFIGWILGIIFAVVIVRLIPLANDTKYEQPMIWIITIIGIVGAGYIGETVFNWFLK